MASVSGLPKQQVSTTKAGNVGGVNSLNKNPDNQSFLDFKAAAGSVIYGGLNEAHPPAGDLLESLINKDDAIRSMSATLGVGVTAAGGDGEAVKAALITALETGDMGAAAKTLVAQFAYSTVDSVVGELTGMKLEHIQGLAETTGLTNALQGAATSVFNFLNQADSKPPVPA